MNRIGKGMMRARSEKEFVELIKETLYEIQEIHRSYEFESDYMSDSLMIVTTIEPEIKAIDERIVDNKFEFTGQGLTFYNNLAGLPGDILPIKPLLIRIHETLIHGLE